MHVNYKQYPMVSLDSYKEERNVKSVIFYLYVKLKFANRVHLYVFYNTYSGFSINQNFEIYKSENLQNA